MVQVSVTVDDEHLAAIAAVADALRDRGMNVERVLDALGIITGSVTEEHQGSLTAIDGVASVQEDLEFRLPPPDAPIQ